MKNMKAGFRFALLAATLSLVCVALAPAAHAQYSYYPLTPCRVVDTRNPNGVNGGPMMVATAVRNFAMRGSCGIPTTAKGISFNVTITGAQSNGYLTIFPSGGSLPVVSTINFLTTDVALANGAISGLSTNAQDLSVYSSANVHVIIDVSGYFQ